MKIIIPDVIKMIFSRTLHNKLWVATTTIKEEKKYCEMINGLKCVINLTENLDK
jgi:hypothetical protein